MQTTDVESLLKSAVSSHQAGRLDAAEKTYRSVLAASSDHPQALHLFGVLQHQRRRNDEALELIDRAIARSPESWDFHCNRSLVLEALDRRDEAIADLRKVTGKTLDPAPWLELAFQLQRAGLPDEAVEALSQLTDNHPGEGRAWSLLGALLQQLGRLDGAETACRKAASLEPSQPEVFNNLAIVQRVSGKLAEAEANVRKAIELQAGFASGWDNLGQIKSAAGDVPGMFEAFSRCAKLRHPVDGPLALRQRPRLARLRHDREQLEYLIERNLIDQRFESCVQTLDAICARPTGNADEINPPVQITPAEQQILAKFYDRMLVNLPIPAMDGAS